MDDAAVRTRLLALGDETRARLADLDRSRDDVVQASRGANVDDEHDPEGATIAFERAQVQALMAKARAQLGEIDLALERLAVGTYGTCETCGEPIGEGRLGVRPTASRCVRHA